MGTRSSAFMGRAYGTDATVPVARGRLNFMEIFTDKEVLRTEGKGTAALCPCY